MDTATIADWSFEGEGLTIGAVEELGPVKVESSDESNGQPESSDDEGSGSGVAECRGAATYLRGKMETSETDDGVFYFESQQFALKGNEDYKKLLCLLIKLEAQNSKAAEDLRFLKKEKKAALQEPHIFIERLKRKELNYPNYIPIPKIPYINWRKYRCHGNIPNQVLPTSADKELMRKVMTGVKEDVNDVKEDFDEKEKTTRTRRWARIRQRMKMPWTEEEDELVKKLFHSMPEMLFAERVKKIAETLSARTQVQVLSRLQRMIIHKEIILNNEELAMLGLRFLPGSDVTACQTIYGYRNTSGLIPSSAPASSESDSDSAGAPSEESEVSDEEGIQSFFHISPEYKRLMQLKKISRVNAKMKASPLLHISFKCDSCGTTPIRGQRWHCVECSGKEERSCDYCELCKRCFFRSHSRRHNVVRIAVDGPS